jgi:enamine deaminase RidA (YjgF/YER057c/UK114 family)
MSSKRTLVPSGSPYEPVIGFSRAVRVGNVVTVSGTAAIKDGKTVGVGDPAAQTRRCLEIIDEALRQAGADMSDVVRTRIFLGRAEDWEAVGRVHGEVFQDVRPASTMVQAAGFINPEWLVEIEADAVVAG